MALNQSPGPALLLALLALSSPGTAQDPTRGLDTLLHHPDLRDAHIGAIVVDLEDGAVLCAHDADRSFTPASTLKLRTAAMALHALGPEFRFTTTLVAHGEIRDGELRGDLELIGGGDPSLDRLDTLIAALHARGVERIAGDVIGNDDALPDTVLGSGWAWDDESHAYSAQLSGLCFAENCVRITFAVDAAGSLTAAPEPATDYVAIDTRAARCAPADGTAPTEPFTVLRQRATNTIVARGEFVPEDLAEPWTVTVENPTLFAAHVLREELIRQGIAVDGTARDRDALAPTTSPGEILATHRSTPLTELLPRLLKDSQNLYGEQLWRRARAQSESDLPAGLVQADGSGLSRYDQLRPRHLTDLLAMLWQSPHRDVVWRSLPIAGADGTLAERFGDTLAMGRVRAKTGTMTHVVTLAGYVSRPEPERAPLVFAVLLNGLTSCTGAEAEALVDAWVVALARHAGWRERGPR